MPVVKKREERREKRVESREKRDGVSNQVSGVRCQVSRILKHLFTFSPFHLFTPSPRHLATLSSRHPSSLLLTTFYLSLLTLLTACNSTTPVIKVALVGPFEGANRAVGYDVIYSARLAVREVNEQGGIGGQRVALVSLDDRGDVTLARETAVSIINDPAIVAVVGHWQPETTAAVADLYNNAGLLFIPMDGVAIGSVSPTDLPADFVQNYEAVTPFDETVGIYAGSAYDAFQFVWLGVETAVQTNTPITRQALIDVSTDLEYLGISGLEIEVDN